MKKLFCIILCLCLIFSIASCKKGKNGNESNASKIIESETVSESASKSVSESTSETASAKTASAVSSNSGTASAKISSDAVASKTSSKPKSTVSIPAKADSEKTVPSGCTYRDTQNRVYTAGAQLPKLTVGDEFSDGVYTYKYGYSYNPDIAAHWSLSSSDKKGWGAKLENPELSSCAPARESINGAFVLFLNYTYYQSCLKTAPELPKYTLEMDGTFMMSELLETAPKIPDGVYTMSSTFCFCECLKSVPTLPSGVTVLNAAFQNCGKITSAPKIPENAVDITNMYYECFELKNCPVIPASVKKMSRFLYGCSNVTGDIDVRCEPEEYDYALYSVGKGKSINIIATPEVAAELEITL